MAIAYNTLTWLTGPGNIANFSIGDPSEIRLLVEDSRNVNATFTFSKLTGDLPPGMTLNSNGIISGIPTYATPLDNYFSTRDYAFVVRAISNDLKVLDGRFVIRITNNVNLDFTWITPAGSLGTVPNNQFYSLKLEAQNQNLGITYSFVSGELPPGMQLISRQVDKTVEVSQAVESNVIFLNNVDTVQAGDYVFGSKIPTAARVITVNPNNNSVTIGSPTTGLLVASEVIKFYAPGYLQGVPTILDPVTVNESRTYRFTVRATNSLGRITDRAFSLNVTNINGPTVEPTTSYLGNFFDGNYFEKQLSVIQINPNVEIDWKIVSGSLPPGLELDANGKISGYIQPVELVGPYGPAGYDGQTTVDGIVTAQQGYDAGPYQFNNLSQSVAYDFTVQAYDGANSDLQTYTINVISRSNFTADSSLPINDTYITVDSGNVRLPILRNVSSILPTGRQDSYYAFKFDGFDFDGAPLTYSIVDTAGTFDGSPFDPLARDDANNGLPGSFDLVSATTSNLPGVQLDADTGWVYGKIDPQSASYEEFTFGVEVCKTVGNVTYCSQPRYFTLPVVGDPNNVVQWQTPSNLGVIDNGTISNLTVTATGPQGKNIIYSLVDEAGVSCRLPQGLKLLPTGDIAGRVSFETFSIDDYATTFDNEQLTIDRIYRFRVRAETEDGTASSTRDFVLTLNVINTEPYDNLYLKAMPDVYQRKLYNSLINDTTIFDPDLIYKASDPNFGIQKELKMLFLSGLTAAELSEYQTAMERNHFIKTYEFGQVKTAYVLDNQYDVKYEVVYVEVVDPGQNRDETGPPLTIDLTDVIDNPYIDAEGNNYKIVYPNSSVNMQRRVANQVGYTDRSSLPDWMTSNQIDPNNPNGFTVPLGFVKAVVIAYAQPGQGQKIAYRINQRIEQKEFNFNRIEFSVDRYHIDNYYSNNYSLSQLNYRAGRETTFDLNQNTNVGNLVGTVSYALTIPYSAVNGRPISFINRRGGLDGVTNFIEGDTVIFAQQENFVDAGPYDGWIDYESAYIGDNVQTPQIEGFGSGSYDTYSVIPGFLEKIQNPVLINRRGGIWRITITNNIVNLEFVQELFPNDRVRIQFGKTYASAVMFYSQTLAPGQTVPYYDVFSGALLATQRRTTFNNDTTKFFSFRDQYYEVGSQDKYLKFPKYGVFN